MSIKCYSLNLKECSIFLGEITKGVCVFFPNKQEPRLDLQCMTNLCCLSLYKLFVKINLFLYIYIYIASLKVMAKNSFYSFKISPRWMSVGVFTNH